MGILTTFIVKEIHLIKCMDRSHKACLKPKVLLNCFKRLYSRGQGNEPGTGTNFLDYLSTIGTGPIYVSGASVSKSNSIAL